MKILHLTDFHYSNKEKIELIQKRLVRSLTKAIKGQKVDFIFFTGDLVLQGGNEKDFENASKIFLEVVEAELGIERTNIFIAPGNHDVNRGKELDDVKKAIDSIKTNEELDEYVTKNDKNSLKASLINLDTYFTFLNEFYQKHLEDFKDKIIDKMYTTHVREMGGKKIGITVINSAWRCFSSKTDYGRLLFPIHYMRKAYEEVKDCDVKILMMHHPLNDFNNWNSFSLEDIIHKDYHLMFSGHTHKNKNTIQLTSGVGIYHCSSSATLSLEEYSSIGYTIIDVDLDSFELSIENYEYNKTIEEFKSLNIISGEIPIEIEKRELNKLRETLKKRYNQNLDQANKLFLSYKEKHDENDFLTLFSNPVLKSESQTTINNTNKASNYSIDTLISSKIDYLIFGKDKSGKTSILYKLLLETIINFSESKVIPLYIKCREFEKTNTDLNVLDFFRDYIELSKAKAENLIEQYHILILADNLTNDKIIESICLFKEKYKNVSIIGTCPETMYNAFATGLNARLGYQNIFIHDITRSEIRGLTVKWPNIKSDEREFVLEKINNLFNQLNIPSNYWTVSLFLWIFEKNSKANFGNNFQLIELYIDNLLDKQNFVLVERYKIDFDDLKEYLAEFAFELVKHHHLNYYQISYDDWVLFTSEFKKRNQKFVINTKELIDLILEKDIVKKEINDKYTFRLNGVFEYFVGMYLAIDETERNEIIEDNHFYLSFANEFEICAGFIKDNKDFVNRIFKKTQEIFKPLNSGYNFSNIDSHLISKIENKLNIDLGLGKMMREKLGKPLPLESQDEFMESVSPSNDRMSEVKQKKFYNEIEAVTDNYEKALYILARVFRNSKIRNNEEFNNQVLDYILNSSCTLGFALMDELEGNKLDLIDEKTTEDELLKLITTFIPLMTQLFFYDSVVQSNLENILKNKIESLENDDNDESQFKLLILYFSLIDLDIKEHEHLIPKIISSLNLAILKNSSLMKLYLYLSLKVNGNKILAKKIEGYIRTQEFEIDSSSKRLSEIDSRIASTKKEHLKKNHH